MTSVYISRRGNNSKKKRKSTSTTLITKGTTNIDYCIIIQSTFLIFVFPVSYLFDSLLPLSCISSYFSRPPLPFSLSCFYSLLSLQVRECTHMCKCVHVYVFGVNCSSPKLRCLRQSPRSPSIYDVTKTKEK